MRRTPPQTQAPRIFWRDPERSVSVNFVLVLVVEREGRPACEAEVLDPTAPLCFPCLGFAQACSGSFPFSLDYLKCNLEYQLCFIAHVFEVPVY